MNRKLTEYELEILREKCKNYSYSTEVKNGLIALGNGIDEEPVGFLPYELLMKDRIVRITKSLLINKPVETTNEQLPINLKIKLMEVLSKHVDIRNSDNLTNRDLYHSFLDWEKEMWELMV